MQDCLFFSVGCIFDVDFSNYFFITLSWSSKLSGSLDGGRHALVQVVVGLVAAGGWRHPAQALGYAPHVRVHRELQQGRLMKGVSAGLAGANALCPSEVSVIMFQSFP